MPASNNIPAVRKSGAPAVKGMVADLDDFEAIGEVAPDWKAARHLQIGRGPARARLAMAQTSTLQLVQVFRAPGVRIVGDAPHGAFLVAVLLDGPGQLVQGRSWERNCLGVMPPGTEFDMTGTQSHSIVAIAVRPDRLDEHALARWGRPFPRDAAMPFLRTNGEVGRRALVATWVSWLDRVARREDEQAGPEVAARMESEVLGAVFDWADPFLPAGRFPGGRRLARRAEGLLRESLSERISLPEVCAALGVAPRTLHASFNLEYGIPPMAYRRALRFGATRRDLLAGGPGTTVSTVASRWGFMEFGYFAVDYRRMFGESPGDTLRRGVGASRSAERLRADAARRGAPA